MAKGLKSLLGVLRKTHLKFEKKSSRNPFFRAFLFMQLTDSHVKQKDVSYNVTLAYLQPGEKLHKYFDLSLFEKLIHVRRTYLGKLSPYGVELFFITEVILFPRLNLITT